MHKKILAAVLSVCTLLSVMTAVVYATNADNQPIPAIAALAAEDSTGSTATTVTTTATTATAESLSVPPVSTTEPGVTQPEWAERFDSFWKVFYPVFDMLYKSGFVVLSQLLAQFVNFIITSLFY
jgi:uncharacterized membrane protein